MNAQELVAGLKAQHKTLQNDLLVAFEKTKLEKEGVAEDIVMDLAKFKKDLMVHLKLEDEEFYPNYFKIKSGNERDIAVGKKFIEEMNEIAKDVLGFLKKYETPKSIDLSSETFKKDLLLIINTLNVRIETEEEGLYDIYLAY